MLLPPPTPTLFPYTTLFRSSAITRAGQGAGQYPAYYEHRHLPHLCGSLSAQPRWYPSGDDFDGPTTESDPGRASHGALLLYQRRRLGGVRRDPGGYI